MLQGGWSRNCYLKKNKTVGLRLLPKVKKLASRSVTISVNLSPRLLLPNHIT